MTRIKSALIWAFAILMMAVATATGLIEGDTGKIMLLVLPIVAVTTMMGKDKRADCGV